MQIDQIPKPLKENTHRDIDPDTFVYGFLRAITFLKSNTSGPKESWDHNTTKLEGALLPQP